MPEKADPPFLWIGQLMKERNAAACNPDKGNYVQVKDCEVLGNIPYPEVHEFFEGLDFWGWRGWRNNNN